MVIVLIRRPGCSKSVGAQAPTAAACCLRPPAWLCLCKGLGRVVLGMQIQQVHDSIKYPPLEADPL